MKPVSLTGRLVDIRCHALRLAARAGAATSQCTDGAPGQPVGLLVSAGAGGTLYTLATPPMALTPHLGRTARLDGRRSPLQANLVRPEQLEIKAADGWKPVALLPDM